MPLRKLNPVVPGHLEHLVTRNDENLSLSGLIEKIQLGNFAMADLINVFLPRRQQKKLPNCLSYPPPLRLSFNSSIDLAVVRLK